MSVILIGVDYSEGARAALAFAHEEARLRGGTLRAVHAWQFGFVDYTGFGGFESSVPEIGDIHELRDAAAAALDATLPRRSPTCTGSRSNSASSRARPAPYSSTNRKKLISWSSVLIGRIRDPIVGRDALIGFVAAAAVAVLNGLSETWLRAQGGWPNLEPTAPLAGPRGYLALVLVSIPHAIREALFFFFLIFLLRAVLRVQWLAAVVFALIFASLELTGSSHPLFNATISFLVLSAFAFLVLRFGLLALCAAVLFNSVINFPQARMASWYFAETAMVVGLAMALAVWAFYTSLGNRKFWTLDD